MKALFSVDKRSHIFSVQEQFAIAKEVGFDGVDYIATLQDVIVHPIKILQYSKNYDIPVLGMHTPLPFVIMTPPILFKRLFALSKYFPDCKILNFHLSGVDYPLSRGLENINNLRQTAHTNGVLLSFESNPRVFPMLFYGKETYDPESFGKFCQKYELPITFDVSHIAQQGYDSVQFFQKYYLNIRLIHLSDLKESQQHLPLGKGTLPLQNLLQEMKKISYKSHVVFELYTFTKNSTKNEIIAEIKDSLKFFRQHTKYSMV